MKDSPPILRKQDFYITKTFIKLRLKSGRYIHDDSIDGKLLILMTNAPGKFPPLSGQYLNV